MENRGNFFESNVFVSTHKRDDKDCKFNLL